VPGMRRLPPIRSGHFSRLRGIFVMDKLPEIFTGRLLSFSESGKFYILSDGKRRFFAGARHFPNGLNNDALVTFTLSPAKQGKLPEVERVIFAAQETEAAL
jgi:hypothetical protein